MMNPNILAALGGGGPNGQRQPMDMAPGAPPNAGAPGPMGGPMAPAPVNPMAMLSMGQQQMGRAFGGNPYDTNAMAEIIAQGLAGAQAGPQPQMPGQPTPGRPPFNPVNAL